MLGQIVNNKIPKMADDLHFNNKKNKTLFLDCLLQIYFQFILQTKIIADNQNKIKGSN